MSRAAFRALRVRLDGNAAKAEAEGRRAREIAEALQEGEVARRAGVKAAKNPHPVGSHQRRAWADGWNAEHVRLGGRRAA
ncbi:hypothetical protein [Sorangium sp. So ce1024]|uniref:hypothetical protein n=1 Tax=Sorangium sp. So ce1024 TaxID=3133327 RepID=UPI003F00775F